MRVFICSSYGDKIVVFPEDSTLDNLCEIVKKKLNLSAKIQLYLQVSDKTMLVEEISDLRDGDFLAVRLNDVLNKSAVTSHTMDSEMKAINTSQSIDELVSTSHAPIQSAATTTAQSNSHTVTNSQITMAPQPTIASGETKTVSEFILARQHICEVLNRAFPKVMFLSSLRAEMIHARLTSTSSLEILVRGSVGPNYDEHTVWTLKDYFSVCRAYFGNTLTSIDETVKLPVDSRLNARFVQSGLIKFKYLLPYNIRKLEHVAMIRAHISVLNARLPHVLSGSSTIDVKDMCPVKYNKDTCPYGRKVVA